MGEKLPGITDDSQTPTRPPDDLSERRRRRTRSPGAGPAPTTRQQPPSITSSLGLDDPGDGLEADAVLDALARAGRDGESTTGAAAGQAHSTRDGIGERLRHHHERPTTRSSEPGSPRGSADLTAPVRAPRRRRTRPVIRRSVRLGSPTAAPTHARRRPAVVSWRALMTLGLLGMLAVIALAIALPGSDPRARAGHAAGAAQLGDFAGLRAALTSFDHGVGTLARSAVSEERRTIAAREARIRRRRLAAQRAARRRRQADRPKRVTQRHSSAVTHTAPASGATSTPTASPTVTTTQQSTSAPTATRSSTTSSSGHTMSKTPTYGLGGILGAGHQG